MGLLGSLATLTAYGFRDQHRVDTAASLRRAQSTLDALNAEAALRARPMGAGLVETTATVTSSRSTGVMVDDAFQVALGLLVMLPGGVPVPIQTLSLVPAIRLHLAQPGCALPVRIDPRDPSALSVDWSHVL